MGREVGDAGYVPLQFLGHNNHARPVPVVRPLEPEPEQLVVLWAELADEPHHRAQVVPERRLEALPEDPVNILRIGAEAALPVGVERDRESSADLAYVK
jgi:hypothetical protein